MPAETFFAPDIQTQRVTFYGAMLWTASGVSICNQTSALRGPELVNNSNSRAQFDRQNSIIAGMAIPIINDFDKIN